MWAPIIVSSQAGVSWNRSAEQLSQFFQQVPRQRGRRQHTHPRRAGCVMKPARLNPESHSGSQEAR